MGDILLERLINIFNQEHGTHSAVAISALQQKLAQSSNFSFDLKNSELDKKERNLYREYFFGNDVHKGIIGIYINHYTRYPDELTDTKIENIVKELYCNLESRKNCILAVIDQECAQNNYDRTKTKTHKTLFRKDFETISENGIQNLVTKLQFLLKDQNKKSEPNVINKNSPKKQVSISTVNLNGMLNDELPRDAVIWIKEIIRRIDSHEDIDYKRIRAALVDKVSIDLNPYSIKSRYIRPPCMVTLLGITKFGDATKWLALIDRVIIHIKNLLISNPQIEEITAKAISSDLQISEVEIGTVFDFMRPLGSFISYSSGNDFKCEKIRFSSVEYFNEYMNYTTIDKLLEKFYDSLHTIDENKENSMLKTITEIKKKLFIIMPMSGDKPSYDDVNDSIKESAKLFNIDAFRIDESLSNEKITDRILSSIKDANFVIADLTDSRPNVFFEAGYALGIGKTPIFIATDGTKLEFDVKDYPIIFFKSQRELREKLTKRLHMDIKNVKDTALQPRENLNTELINFDENDIKALLAGWAEKQAEGKNLLETVHFKNVDFELGIPNGSSKVYLKDIVIQRWNYVVDVEGQNAIKFKYGSFEVKSRGRHEIGHGINLDMF